MFNSKCAHHANNKALSANTHWRSIDQQLQNIENGIIEKEGLGFVIAAHQTPDDSIVAIYSEGSILKFNTFKLN